MSVVVPEIVNEVIAADDGTAGLPADTPSGKTGPGLLAARRSEIEAQVVDKGSGKHRSRFEEGLRVIELPAPTYFIVRT